MYVYQATILSKEWVPETARRVLVAAPDMGEAVLKAATCEEFKCAVRGGHEPRLTGVHEVGKVAQ